MRIVFSQKQLQHLTRLMIINDEQNGGDTCNAQALSQRLIQLWHQEGDSAAFMTELERLIDLNLWKASRIDVVLTHTLFNAVDELLQKLATTHSEILRGLQDGDTTMINTDSAQQYVVIVYQEDRDFNEKVLKVLKFLKAILIYASSVQNFNSIEHLVKLYDQYRSVNNLAMIEELLGVFITLSSKHNEKKTSSTVPAGTKTGLDRFNDEAAGFMKQTIGLIRSFDFLIDLLLNGSSSTDYQTLIAKKVTALSNQQKIKKVGSASEEDPAFEMDESIKAQIEELQRLKFVGSSSTEDIVLILFRSINLYLNVGNIQLSKDKYIQATELEQLLPPKLFVRKLIKILSSTNLSKRVQIQAMNILFLFIILDLNQLFSYVQPADNQYYAEACLHHELYISLLQKLARYHAYQRVKTFYEDSIENDDMIRQQKELTEDEEHSEVNFSDTIKSQRFFNSFLNFMCNLLNFKNRQLQTQLYPQFLKPLLAIVYVRPTSDNVYLININCQLKAAKLLKEVVKMSSLEEPGAVEKIIDRLKEEIVNLHQKDVKWRKLPEDDCESDILTTYRQDMIRTLLRFLSYTIIRNDPNAINFTQNFVANSRKIMESGLIQNEMIKYIFEANLTLDDKFLTQAIDPVILQCVQLISYLFNDLPQKIPQFIENHVFPSILESLSIRMPVQPDLIILIMKLIQTLCLNSKGTELVSNSQVLYSFCRVASNVSAHKQFVNENKVMVFSEVVQQVASQNKEVSVTFFKAILKNFEIMVDKAWDVTKSYVAMEQEVKADISKDQQELLRFQYEKKQVHLELTFEASSNLLWFFIENDPNIVNNLISEAVLECKSIAIQILENVITTPIVASACSQMFGVFIEALLQILMIFGSDEKVKFLHRVISNIELQINNMEKLLNTKNFDEVFDVEAQVQQCMNLRLAETEYGPERKYIVNDLRGHDQASVVFGKIAFYAEIIQRGLPQTKMQLFNLAEFDGCMEKMFKLQAMINRYHATKYEKDILKEIRRMKELLKIHQEVINMTDFSAYTPIKEPVDERDELKNLYFKYEIEKIQSLTDQKARESFKTAIELQLDENISHTSNMCQQAIRKLLISFLRQLNRDRTLHFSESVKLSLLEFNKLIGGLIADEFLDFQQFQLRSPHLPGQIPSETEAMKYCCQFSAVFSEFNKVLFGNYSSGVLLIEFFERGGLECIQEIIMWIVKYLYALERDPAPKSLNQCKNIQLLWSHLIDFFVQFLEGKYLDQQFQMFLIAFKTNPTAKLKPAQGESDESYNKEYERAMKDMKSYFTDIYARVLKFLFVELNTCKYVSEFKQGQTLSVFEYFDLTSELFLVSMVDIYGFACRGLSHIKFLQTPNQTPTSLNKQTPLQDQSDFNQKVQTLKEMGFDEEKAKQALTLSHNSLAIASDMLLQDLPALSLPPIMEVAQESSSVAPVLDAQVEEKQFEWHFTHGSLTKCDIFQVLSKSFRDYIRFTPSTTGKLVRKCDLIDAVFFKVGADPEEPVAAQQLLQEVKVAVLDLISESQINKDTSNMGALALALTNLLSYRHGTLVTVKEVFEVCFEMAALFQLAISKFKDEISAKNSHVVEWDKKREKTLNEMVRQIEMTIQLFKYITQEGKVSSDLDKLGSILNQRSSLDDSIKDIQDQLDSFSLKNSQNIFHNNKEQTAEIYQKVTLCMVELFKSMHSMDPDASMHCESQIHELVLRGLETLNFLMSIKGFPGFECQSCFLQNEGLRALFGIRTLSQDALYQGPTNLDSKKLTDIQVQSKILLQMLSQNENSQIRVYESLIKSVLFIFFQERYKQEEGTDIKTEFQGNVEDAKPSQLLQTATKHQSKKKQTQPQSPNKKSKSLGEENLKHIKAGRGSKSTLFKKIELGEAPLEDFIQFFNSVMQIQDFKSFLLACQNVCIIKKKIKPVAPQVAVVQEEKKEEEVVGSRANRAARRRENRAKRQAKEEEKKEGETETKEQVKLEEQEAYYIMLNPQSLKDMINQYEQSLQPPQVVGSIKDNDKLLKGHIQQFQQEIMFTLLDQFIEQLRDQQLLILQHCKQKQNPSTLGLASRIDQNGHLVIKNAQDASRLSYQVYLFDYVTILSHFTYMLTHSPILNRCLLRHKEGKTFKFIIRNLYFLMTMTVEYTEKVESKRVDKEVTVIFDNSNYNLNLRRAEIVKEFFKRVMFDNPHLTALERRMKNEARIIFQKEVLKNLCDHAGPNQLANSKYFQWPQLRIVFNMGALWLISIILKEEDKEDKLKAPQQDKQFETLIMNMQKYRNTFRQTMIKNIIVECQQQFGKIATAPQFVLLHIVQLIQKDIKEHLKFFQNQKEPFQLCIQTITNILKPFEGSQTLWGGSLEGEKDQHLTNNDLGFLQEQPGAAGVGPDDGVNDDDDESDDEEEDESDESSEDDELLDSELSERNFRFSQHDMIEDEEDDPGEYGSDDDSGERHRHHHHRHDEDSDSYGDEEDDENEEEEMFGSQLIENILNQAAQNDEDIDIIDYGQEEDDDEEGEEDYDDEILDELQDQAVPAVARQSQDGAANSQEEDEEYDEEDYDSEEGDDSYDQEIEDEEDQEEAQIFVGRNPDNLERLSNLDLMRGAGNRQPHHIFRRDDIVSMNNMSVDMFNIGNRNNVPIDHDHDEHSAEFSADQLDQSQEQNAHPNIGRPQEVADPRALEIFDIIGLLQENPVSRARLERRSESEEAAYKPVLTLLDLVQLGSDMQRRSDIYKFFIKETEQPKPMQVEDVPSVATNMQSNEMVSTRSQFSGRPNPFMSLAANIPQGNPFEQNQYQRAPQIQDDIEIDPEFMENLDQDGLANITQTENLMNFISNQSNRVEGNNINTTIQLIESVQNRQERAQMFRNMPMDIFNQLPPNLYTEGLIQRRLDQNQPPIQLQISGLSNLQPPNFFAALSNSGSTGEMRVRTSSWHQMRGRLQSLDQQINDITDFSRQANDPHVRNNQWNPGNAVQNFMSSVALKDNTIFNSFQQYLQDQIFELTKRPIIDSKGNDVGLASEQIIQNGLLCHNELSGHSFTIISEVLDMVMVWIKYISNGLFILQRESYLMKMLYRLPNIRKGLAIKTVQWLIQGIESLRVYHEQVNSLNQGSLIQTDNQGRVYFVPRGDDLPGTLDLQSFIIHCLQCIKHLIQDNSAQGILLLLVPTNDHPDLHTLITLLNDKQSVQINLNKSLLAQIIDQMVTFFRISKECPTYITGGDAEDQKEIETSYEEIISAISGIMKLVALSHKYFKEITKDTTQKSGVETIDKDLFMKLCELFLTNEFKSRPIQRSIKSIFSDISVLGDGQVMIETFFKDSLSDSLQRFVTLIEESSVDLLKLKKEVTIINSILKFAKVNAKQETNICDTDLFFRVVKSISGLIERKNFDQITSSIQQSAFMFKEEFRTIMTTLFILFEYNLKFIFTDPNDDFMQLSKPTKKKVQPKIPEIDENQMLAIMSDAQEIKHSSDASKERSTLIEAIDQHLQFKIKDEHAREDQRLKVFIRFCLEHKKVINSFIRANQQVLNESLRNVIIKVPQVLDFDNKRLLFRSQIKKIQKRYRLKYLNLEIRRDKVFEDSYEQLKALAVDKWKGQMNVEFSDEQGIDEGGLTKEWFILLSQEIFNPDLALFLQSNAGSTYYPNPKSVVHPDYISQFKFIGRIVGKALYEQQLLDCYFVKALYKIILGLPLTYHDVEDFDNDLYRNLKWCLDNPTEGLGLTFSETQDYFGQNEEIEIIEGGKDIEVTDVNKYDYVQRMAYRKLYLAIKKQIDAFLQGFYEIIPKPLVQLFDNRELELLISGLPNIDIADLKENTVYQNYTQDSPVVKWLFEALEEFENSERAEFIQFVTGSSKVPVEGFKGLRGSRGPQKFQIVKFFTNDNKRLPQAHTCFKQLELPEYASKEQLKDRLLTAIKEGKTFGFA